MPMSDPSRINAAWNGREAQDYERSRLVVPLEDALAVERELIGAQAELEAITEAIGTRDGHSSVPHVIALKATIAEQAKEIERLTATVAAKDEAIKRLNGWLDNDRRALGEEG